MYGWIRRLLPAHLGGVDFNIWNVLIARRRGDLSYCVDWCHLRVKLWDKSREPLWSWVRQNKPQTIVEVGIGTGQNAEEVIKIAQPAKYVCFDNLMMSDSRIAFYKLSKKHNVLLFLGDSRLTMPMFSDKADLIFIDGCHDYEFVKSDWKNAQRLMHNDSTCFFHDYDMDGVKRAVDEIGAGFDKKVVHSDDGKLWAIVTRHDRTTEMDK